MKTFSHANLHSPQDSCLSYSACGEPGCPFCGRPIPRLNWLDRLVLRALGGRSTFKARCTGGADPYAGHDLIVKLPFLTVTVSDVIDWSAQAGRRFYNTRDRFVMAAAKRVFKAFETRSIVEDSVADQYDGFGDYYR